MAYGTNAPFGLAPVRTLSGANWNEQINNYIISYNSGTNVTTTPLYVGDPVQMTANGTITNYATNTGPILGVFVGAVYTDINGVVQYTSSMPTGTAIKAGTFPMAKIVDDPWVIFQIQSDSFNNTLGTQDSIGMNYNFTGGTTPNTLLGQSSYTLGQDTMATTPALPLRALRFAETVDKDITKLYPVYEVLINNHFYKQLTGI